MRQLLQDLNGALSDATGSSDTEYHWSKLTRHAAGSDIVCKPCQSILHVIIVEVHVAAANQERRLELLLQQVLPNATQEVKRTSNACVSAKSNETLRHPTVLLRLTNALEVNKPNLLLKKFVKQRHVVVLGFDSMREEEVSLVGEQVGNWNLLDAKDDRSLADILLDYGARVLELIITVASNGAWLDQDTDAHRNNLTNLVWSERAATFPLVLALAKNANNSHGVLFDHKEFKFSANLTRILPAR